MIQERLTLVKGNAANTKSPIIKMIEKNAIIEVKVIKIFNCNCCKKQFTSKKACKSRTPKFCSKECYAESLRMHKKCLLCGEEIINKHSASLKNRKYCSVKCRVNSKKGLTLSNEWKLALSNGRKNSDKCKGPNLYNWKGGNETFKERHSIYTNTRRSAQKLEIDKIFMANVLKAQKNKCFYCESELVNYKAIEHLTPLSRGGDNQNWNLVYACKSCNSKKRSKTLEEYAIKHKLLHLITKFDYIYASSIS